MRRVQTDDKTLAANLWPLCACTCILLHTPAHPRNARHHPHEHTQQQLLISVFRMRPFLRVKPVEVIVIMCQYLWGLGVHEAIAGAPVSGMWISVSEVGMSHSTDGPCYVPFCYMEMLVSACEKACLYLPPGVYEMWGSLNAWK